MVDSVTRAELLLDNGITDELEKELIETLRRSSVDATVRRQLSHRSGTELGWLVLLALPLQAFLSGIGAEVVKDVYAAVKHGVGRVVGRSASTPAEPNLLVLQDIETGVKIVIEGDLPAEAVRQLATLDLSAYRLGPLHFDKHRGVWRSELDEAAG